MSSKPDSPAPLLNGDTCAVLFDGTCKLCNGWARFVIQHDSSHRIRLATVQSNEGQELLAWAGLPQNEFNTIVLISDNQIFIRSDAMLKILAKLGAPWSWLNIMRFCPRTMRDWVYDRIALNRYRLFGQYDASRAPDADHAERFLKLRE